MIKHIVMWKLKDFAEGKNKLENARIIKERVEGLKDKIKEIRYIEIGINSFNDPQAYDVVLISEFENYSDLESYQNHPEHVKVAEFISKVREARVVVDYEI
ncbi:Dabb family protein [Thermobrachium celere]|uniref:Dabb family protein n=1 Tax=Thermobrachium celere TaxID=53422 RepID=UPI001941B811|nr:Dabb family protein [Thermobrachium celere]GFR36184.1 stress responsive protein [Thermobrachium celere]